VWPANQNRACQIKKVQYTSDANTWSLSVPASSRLCCMANWSKLSSSSLIGSLRPGPSVVYSGGGSNTDGSTSHCRGGGVWPESSDVRVNNQHSYSQRNLKPEQKRCIPASVAPCGECTVTELTGSSQPQRLLNVTRAFNTWKRGISKSKNMIKVNLSALLCYFTGF